MKKKLFLSLLAVLVCFFALCITVSAAELSTEKEHYAVGDEVEFTFSPDRRDVYYLYCGEELLDVQANNLTGGEITFTAKLDERHFEHGDYTFTVWHTSFGLIGAEKAAELELHIHTVELRPGKAATCTENGMTDGKYCSQCDLVVAEAELIPALGHEWGETTVEKAATCSEKGRRVCTCARCGEVSIEDIPMKEHTEVDDPAVAATCTAKGKTAGKHCIVCGTVTVAQKDTVPLGHDWSEGAILKNATCSEKGEKLEHCARCGLSETHFIPTLPHTEVTDPAVPATCEKDGHGEGKHCSVCGKVTKTPAVLPALGHEWDSGAVTKEPTASEPGEMTFTCKHEGCGEVMVKPIEPTGKELPPAAGEESGQEETEKKGSAALWLIPLFVAVAAGGYTAYSFKKKMK